MFKMILETKDQKGPELSRIDKRAIAMRGRGKWNKRMRGRKIKREK